MMTHEEISQKAMGLAKRMTRDCENATEARKILAHALGIVIGLSEQDDLRTVLDGTLFRADVHCGKMQALRHLDAL